MPPDKIDPAGNLSRQDYLALRHRGKSRQAEVTQDLRDDEEEDEDALADEAPEEETPPAPPQKKKTKRSPAPPIPDLPLQSAVPPAPQFQEKDKLVSVTVTENVPLRDILIELGREAGANLELDPRISGSVIFTAHQQPFYEVLKRLCALAGLRYRAEGTFIRIELDEPYQQTYALDYPSLSRRSTSEVGIATNVFDVDVTNTSGGTIARSAGSASTDNNSISKISAVADADFWAELEKSLIHVLATTPKSKALTGGLRESAPSSQTTPNFSIDKQAGLVTVFGNATQQEAVSRYLKHLQEKVLAQVLIEARIIEVELKEEYQSGINWRTLFSDAANAAARFGTVGAGAPFTTAVTAADGVFTASLKSKDFSGILNLVRTFGTTRILSSPRLTALNNQAAVLKVARNEVYFTTTAQYSTNVNASGVVVSGTPVFSSTPRTVPVGLVMTVQPSIDAVRGRITMTLRPTISRVVDHVNDPSVALNAAGAGVSSTITSQVPVLAVREMDSVLQLRSGEVAVMGGLMQDSSINEDKGVPPFDTLPGIGSLAKSRDNDGTTSELVILLRATILDTPPPDEADAELYERYNSDPRPLPMPD